ncbi:MAG: chain length determinant protein EpsF [Burkholderiales bacterium]
MNSPNIQLVLRARWKIALFVLLAVVGATLGVADRLPKQYVASTSLVIDVRSPDPIAAMLLPTNLGTQIDIIRSERVARLAVRLLNLDENPDVRQQWREETHGEAPLDAWMGGLMLKHLTVTPGRDSNIVNIEYRTTNPAFAAAVANAFAQAYVETTIEMRVEPAKQYAKWFGEQGKSLREALEKAQSRLSAFQQEKGIVQKDERLDTETARLNELATQLSTVQAQTVDARSKQLSGAASATLPEVLGNTVIAGLRSSIAQKEAALKEAAVNLGTRHPQYIRMESELADLKKSLEEETRHVAKGFSSSRAVGKDKEKELLAAIAAQKKKVLRLKGERDELAVLQRDVDAAQSAYDAVTKRFNQASLESQATRANISVLNPATTPLEPAFPKPLRTMVLLALSLGVALGIGAAYALEYFDRRIRTADDLAEMLQLPVLGVIPGKRDGARRALGRSRPALALR